MKKAYILIAVIAVMAAASAAQAQVKIDFDGKTGMESASFKDFLNTPDASMPAPAAADIKASAEMPARTFNVTMEIKAAESKATGTRELLCAPAAGLLACQDKATGQQIKKDDMFGQLIATLWARSAQQGFGAKRGGYTNCSSGHLFSCEEYCRQWTTVSEDTEWSIGTNGASYGHTTHQECTDMSYKCTDMGAGTC